MAAVMMRTDMAMAADFVGVTVVTTTVEVCGGTRAAHTQTAAVTTTGHNPFGFATAMRKGPTNVTTLATTTATTTTHLVPAVVYAASLGNLGRPSPDEVLVEGRSSAAPPKKN